MATSRKFRKIGLIALFIALAALFAIPAHAGVEVNCCPPVVVCPTPVTNTGQADVKVDQVQGASGVAGLVTDYSKTTGCVFQETESYSEQKSAATGNNNICDGDGIVNLSRSDFSYDKTKTCGDVNITKETTANVYQNSANMNSSLIVSATACTMPTLVNASQNQTYTQSINCAVIPGAGGGTVNSSYTGYTSASVKLGNNP